MPPSTRDKIIFSAKKLLSEGGFKEMTMQRIADDVEVTKAALYHFFSSKEDIYVAVMNDLISQVTEETRAIDDENASPEQKLKSMITSRLTFGSKNKSIIQFWDMAQRTIDHEKLKQLCTSHQELRTLSKKILDENMIPQSEMALLVLMSSVLKFVKDDQHMPPLKDFSEYLLQMFLKQRIDS
ncbi:MAG: TetR/AcrR family transcriptional regulator [Candidatus Gracilibacteria bacterium]|nr:TetR/AcrR family transcriptional regulator [Candidatus Gracilibacteria bacterium]